MGHNHLLQPAWYPPDFRCMHLAALRSFEVLVRHTNNILCNPGCSIGWRNTGKRRGSNNHLCRKAARASCYAHLGANWG